METTVLEYDSIIKKCEDIFAKKMKDYGSAWRILRISSLTDQIFIKAQRIRSIESKGVQIPLFGFASFPIQTTTTS